MELANIQNIPLGEQLRVSNPKINQNFQNLNNEIAANKTDADNKLEAHKNSATAHPAQNIPYSGDIIGATNVKQALDNTKQTIDDLILGSGDSGPEVAAARGGHPTLGDRLDSSDAQLADTMRNVKQYGATGDGSDQTIAFQAIIDSTPDGTHQTFHIPKGSYTVGALNRGTRTITWIAEQGLKITGSLPGALLQPYKGLMLSLPLQEDEGGGWRFEVRRTDSALGYAAGTQAIIVVQNKDSEDLPQNGFSPGVQMDFVSVGNGYVDAENRYSGSIWQGVQTTQDKSGDGSAHCYSALGQLKAVGPGGYNELGLFQGQATNISSTNGTMSGVEVLLADGIGSEAGENHATAISGVLGRVKRYNAGLLPVSSFVASSEGPVAATSILTTNKQGTNTWERGIDFAGASFNNGRAVVIPNNSFYSGINTDGSISNLLGVGGLNQTVIKASTDAGGISMTNEGGTTLLALDNDLNNPVVIRVNGFPSRVVVGAPDSGGTGYRMLRVAN